MRSAVRVLAIAVGLALGLPSSSPAACRTVTYTPPEIVPPLLGDLCTPAGRRAQAGVVIVHGGGAVNGNRAGLSGFAALLRRGAIATLAIDYTLLAPTDPGPLYPRPERDVKLAVQWMRAQSGATLATSRRIFALGQSAGARLGAQALVTPDDPFFYDGAPTWGVSDRIAGFIGFAGPYSGRIVNPGTDGRYYGGPPDSTDPAVQQRRRLADSIRLARRASGPVLLFHGERDRNVPIAESIRFAAALRRARRDVTFVRVPAAAHRPTAAQTRSYAKRVIAWVQSFPRSG